MSHDQVIIVDTNDNKIGTMEKMEAHKKGVLHRAFSVFIYNSNNELLLQKRALDKYHSGGLWTNTCCSHPRPDESVTQAAQRRLFEEVGLHCFLTPLFNFIYKSELDNGMIEYEFDHVLIGKTDIVPKPNDYEIADWKYLSIKKIKKELQYCPDKYTIWFPIAFNKLLERR